MTQTCFPFVCLMAWALLSWATCGVHGSELNCITLCHWPDCWTWAASSPSPPCETQPAWLSTAHKGLCFLHILAKWYNVHTGATMFMYASIHCSDSLRTKKLRIKKQNKCWLAHHSSAFRFIFLSPKKIISLFLSLSSLKGISVFVTKQHF